MTTRRELKRRLALLLLPIVCAAVPVSAADLDESIPGTAGASMTHEEGVAAGLDEPGESPAAARDPLMRRQNGAALGLKGYLQAELAKTLGGRDHWSKMLVRGELSSQGRINEHVKWKLSGRVDYDAVYDITDFYPGEVRRDQRLNLRARENYLDVGSGNWDIRLGRQQIVWGEIVGLFFADVVSAKDMREFLLPEFDILRIPQWAARAEYAGDGFHAEVVWVPIPSYDEIGKPGAEFFPPLPPAPPGVPAHYLGESRPARSLSNTNYGVRLSTLRNGWDVSGFYYRSMDTSPTFYRQITAGPQPGALFEARHDRITQFGSTLAKDFGTFVVKAEAIYTRGRNFSVLRAADTDGVVPQNTFDWVAGVDAPLPGNARVNVQLFQRIFFEHDADIIPEKRESGYSILLAQEFANNVEAQVLWLSSLDRADWVLRPRVTWRFEKNWRLAAGVDVFHGPPFGFFGRFANRDRVYTELRYSF